MADPDLSTNDPDLLNVMSVINMGNLYKRSINLLGYYLSQHIELIKITFMYCILLCLVVMSCDKLI